MLSVLRGFGVFGLAVVSGFCAVSAVSDVPLEGQLVVPVHSEHVGETRLRTDGTDVEGMIPQFRSVVESRTSDAYGGVFPFVGKQYKLKIHMGDLRFLKALPFPLRNLLLLRKLTLVKTGSFKYSRDAKQSLFPLAGFEIRWKFDANANVMRFDFFSFKRQITMRHDDLTPNADYSKWNGTAWFGPVSVPFAMTEVSEGQTMLGRARGFLPPRAPRS